MINFALLCLNCSPLASLPASDCADYYFDKTWIAVGPKQSEG